MFENEGLVGVLEGSHQAKILAFKGLQGCQEIGEGSTLVAVHDEVAYFRVGDRIDEVAYEMEDGRIVLGEVTRDVVATIHPDAVDAYAALQIRRIARDMMDESVDPAMLRNRLHVLVDVVSPEGLYRVEDATSRLAKAMRPEWVEHYAANMADIRRSLRGHLTKLESSVPKTRYTRIDKQKVSEFTEELRRSFDILIGLAERAVDNFSGLVFDDADRVAEGLKGAGASLAEEMRDSLVLARKLRALVTTDGLAEFCSFHDALADRMVEAVVMGAYMTWAIEKAHGE